MKRNTARDQSLETAIEDKDGQDSVTAKKHKLREQINNLKSIILEIESNLDISRFKNVTPVSSNNTDFPISRVRTIRNVNAKLKHDLYMYAGFSCVSFTEEQYTFHLCPSEKSDKGNTYTVQVLNKSGEGSLGKWVMPMSIDMEELTSKLPLEQLNNIPFFLKTCKHYIDCYFVRQQQFQTLMETVSTIKYCNLQSNFGYTRITLELPGVHDTEHDSYMDIILYLLYNAAAARPYKIRVDSKGTKLLNKQTANSLISSLKSFKSLDLSSAFETVLKDGHGRFTWRREEDEDSPLELNNLSDNEEEEEGFLEDRQPKRRVTMRSRLTIKRKQKKRRTFPNTPQQTEKLAKTEQSTAKEIDSIGTEKIPKHKRKIPMEVQETPLNKVSAKLKQTKLRFNLENKNSSPPSKPTSARKEPMQSKQSKVLTSTPMHQNFPKMSASTSFSISDIPVEDSGSQDKNVLELTSETISKSKLRTKKRLFTQASRTKRI